MSDSCVECTDLVGADNLCEFCKKCPMCCECEMEDDDDGGDEDEAL